MGGTGFLGIELLRKTEEERNPPGAMNQFGEDKPIDIFYKPKKFREILPLSKYRSGSTLPYLLL